MPRLFRSWLIWWWCFLSPSAAVAVEVTVVFPEGPPTVGDEIPLEIVLHDAAGPVTGQAPELIVAAGRVVHAFRVRSRGPRRRMPSTRVRAR